MRQLGVIRDKQAFSAAEVEKNTSFVVLAQECFCLSRMTSEISHLLTARFRTRLLVNGHQCPYDKIGLFKETFSSHNDPEC